MFLNNLRKFFIANFKLFSLIIPVIILGCGYLYLLKPKYIYLKETGSLTLQSLKKSLLTKKEYLENLKKLKKSYNNLSMEDREKLEEILNWDKDIPNLFVHFENLVEKRGMTLASINFAEGKGEGAIKTLNIDLAVAGGNYQILKDFLDDLEKDIKIIDVDSVIFSAEGYNLALKTYYLTKSGIKNVPSGGGEYPHQFGGGE